eukprot:PhM_4_TR1426/c0_g1_i1/m.66704
MRSSHRVSKASATLLRKSKMEDGRGTVVDFFLSVRFLLPFTVVVIVAVMAMTTILLMVNNTNDAVANVVTSLQNQVLSLVENRVLSHLGQVLDQNMASARDMLKSGVPKPATNMTPMIPTYLPLVEVLDRVVTHFPLISVHYIFLGRNGRVIGCLANDKTTNQYAEERYPTGLKFWAYTRGEPSTINYSAPLALDIPSYRGYERSYFTNVDHTIPLDYAWTNPYMVGPLILFTNTISLVDDKGEFLGVMGADTYVSTLQEFMSSLRPTQETKAFVVDPNNYLVIATHGNIVVEETGSQRVVSNSSDTTIAAAGRYLEDVIASVTTATFHSSFHDDGRKWLLAAKKMTELRTEVYIVVVTPESEFLDQVTKETNKTMGVCVGIAAAGLLLIVALCLFISNALNNLHRRLLISATLDETDDVKPSALTEVRNMEVAYQRLSNELRHIKGFVPQNVLSRIDQNEDEEEEETDVGSESEVEPRSTSMSSWSMTPSNQYSVDTAVAAASAGSGKALNTDTGLSQRRVTVLILNLNNFHATSQRVSSGALVRMHTDVMDVIQGTVDTSRGVLENFSGDHFTITFNACRYHLASHAVAAAGVITTVDTELKQRSSELAGYSGVRMGAATGLALVGNLGTNIIKRFNIISPVMSQAHFLQQLCKVHGTSNLISMSMCAAAEQRYVVRCVDVAQLPCDKAVTAVATVAGVKEGTTEEWMYELQNAERAFVDVAEINDVYRLYAAGEVRLAQRKIEESCGLPESVRDDLKAMCSKDPKQHVAELGKFYLSLCQASAQESKMTASGGIAPIQ